MMPNSQKGQVMGWGPLGGGGQVRPPRRNRWAGGASACLFGLREVAATPSNSRPVSSSLLREEATGPNSAMGTSPAGLCQNQGFSSNVSSPLGQGPRFPRPQFPCRPWGP